MRRMPVLALALMVPAAAAQSPYGGLQDRRIKALSADEVAGYLAGRGMGLALPAELNGYPGPKHVLELADRLELTDEQRERTRRAFDRMHEEAVRLGRELVERERELDAMFAERRADPEGLRRAVEQIAGVRGRLRHAHLRAHLEMIGILSPPQVHRYAVLRGYPPD